LLCGHAPALVAQISSTNDENISSATHPRNEAAASSNQNTATRTYEGFQMTKIATLSAAFVLFAPLAVALMLQAAQIFA
jgi:hypothetical protein